MSRHVTVSAKIPIELKRKIVEFGININQLIRRALEEEVKKREIEKLKKMAMEIKKVLEKIPEDELVKIMRETRETK
ncbi:MAG: hypothetical protein J7J22_01330 [Candidatus Verstraetearchaeota archaeon]|nr:hypothetical protein [Candidatus Verstraetearchaeota archaeon]